MLSELEKCEYRKYKKLVSKQIQLENQLKSINAKLLKCKPDNFLIKKQEDFAQVREIYFQTLQSVVAENLKYCSSTVNADTIESLSLIVEQNALLESMQQSAYQRAVSDIIKDIREATSRNSLYPIFSHSLPNESQEATTDPPKEAVKSPCCPETNGNDIDEINNVSSWVMPTPEQSVQPEYSCPAPSEDVKYHEIDPDLADFIINFEGVDEEINQEVPQSYDSYDIESLIGILEGNEKPLTTETEQDKSEANLNCPIANEPPKSKYPKITQMEMWQNERYIYMHKVLKKCSTMDRLRFYRTRKLFTKYFGDDSDYEQEDKFNNREKYLNCCARRILPLIISYITPYQTQIHNSDIFRQLAQRIANSLVTIIESPTHLQIEQFVARFFESGKKFITLNDVWLFELE